MVASENDIPRLLHALQVHQVELEMQNEELRQARGELEESQSRYQDLFDQAPVGYCTLDANGEIAEANHTLADLLGVSRSALIGQALVRFVFVANRDDWRRLEADLRTIGAPGRGVLRMLRLGEGRFWARLEATAARGEEGRGLLRVVITDVTPLKEAGEALRQGADLLSHTEEISATGGWRWDIARQEMTWTEGVWRIHGLRPDILPLDPQERIAWSLDCYPPEDRAAVKEAFARCTETGEPYDLECRFIDATGRRMWVRTAGRAIKEGDRIVQVLGNIMDVTARKQAEIAQEDARDSLECILNAIGDPVFVKDQHHRMVMVNDALCRLIDRPRDKILGRTDYDFFPREQVDEFWRIDDLVLAHGEDNLNEESITDAQGAVRVISTHKTRYVDKDCQRFIVGVARDISDRRRAELNEREAGERYRMLLQTITNGVAIYEAQGEGEDFIFVDINPAGERLSRVRREEILGRGVLELFPGIRAAGLFEVFQRVWRTGEPEKHPNVLYQDERIKQWVTNWVYRLPSGEIAAVYEDVTRTKEAERRVQSFSRQVLHAREDERRQLAMALHHDLGSISVGVLARLDSVDDEINARRIREAKAASALCREALLGAVARLKRISLSLRPPDLEILGLSASLRQHLTRVSEESGLRIRFEHTRGEREIDESRAITLFRIAQEALTNVVKHAEARSVDVRLRVAEGRLRLSVQDDGRGLDPATLQSPREGAMGLISMREMALALGGEFKVSSPAGSGARVTVTLPLEEEAS